MGNRLAHRGPDDSGTWVEAESAVAFAFRRLSILDVSPEGHQPMVSASGRYVLVFNGEIYNFADLRSDLVRYGHHFRGHSDTEVMLASFDQWGIGASVRKFNGMFAFAVWDAQERAIVLGRDRLGKKPLYYGWQGETFIFGSELKALRAHPEFRSTLNRDSLVLFMRHGYVPSPYSIYDGICTLPAGNLLTVGVRGGWGTRAPTQYWSARVPQEALVHDPVPDSEDLLIEQLDALLRNSVAIRMVADVPLGAFLSGGIDSSLVVALMQAQSDRQIKTFTIGFREKAYDEAPYARRVARHLGTQHTELIVTARQALEVVPNLPALYDEPFADASQIPMYLVSQLARRSVTVCLSGDGGDELFGGYSRYQHLQTLWRMLQPVPGPVKRLASAALSRMIQGPTGALAATLPRESGARSRVYRAQQKMITLSTYLHADRPEALYHQMMSYWAQPLAVVIGAHEPPTALTDQSQWASLPHYMQRIMYSDMVMYLPDDILVKVDRASMRAGLEARAPLLDYRIAEFALRLPLAMKLRNGSSKWLLRRLLSRYVPSHLVERPKMGFGVPIGSWLRGPLRAWAEDLLSEQRLRQGGLLNPAPIREKWTEHIGGKRDWDGCLWNVLMFQAWIAAQNGS
jgi:asparagine synthase (glutamine-hydrolysing)